MKVNVTKIKSSVKLTLNSIKRNNDDALCYLQQETEANKVS